MNNKLNLYVRLYTLDIYFGLAAFNMHYDFNYYCLFNFLHLYMLLKEFINNLFTNIFTCAKFIGRTRVLTRIIIH